MTDPGMTPALDREVPGIGRVLRTPDDCFEGIVDYPWEPHYAQLSNGLHMAYIDAGPADAILLGHLLLTATAVARQLGHPEARIVINDGATAGQSVFHLHVHVLAGRALHWPPG
jgi:histidine triad (HIT) family protein